MVSFSNIHKYGSGKDVVMMSKEMDGVEIVNRIEHKISCNTSKVCIVQCEFDATKEVY